MSAQCHLQAVSISLACLVPIVSTMPRLADYLDKQTQYDDLDEEYRMFIEKYNHNHRPSMQNFGTYVNASRIIILPKYLPMESISLEALRRAAGGPSDAERRDAERRRATLNNAFRTAPFDHLLTLTQPKVEIKDKLDEIFSSISELPLVSGSGASSPLRSYQQSVPPYTKYFPELFLY
ncbi:EFR3 cmp44E-like protein [Operophtera brumata]|uniref:EFR3 cmp44E-like protein n=1 Tax=Operophtera brumata TaxID=104452 RepID=A0A0L7KTS5_OPEBR|nr:EFR3 cmp44E-like protein [Operophtera brumata]